MAPKPILLSLLGICATSGMAVGGYFFMQPTNIGELLRLKKIKLLELDKDEEQWKKLVAKHNGREVTVVTESGEIKIKTIEELGDISTKNNGIQSLKDKCKELLKKPIKKDDKLEINKKAAMEWCSASSSIFKEKTTQAPAGPKG